MSFIKKKTNGGLKIKKNKQNCKYIRKYKYDRV